QIAVGWDNRRIGEAILLRRVPIVGEKPSSHVHTCAVGIVEFYGVDRWRYRVRQRFVDVDNGNDRDLSVGLAGSAQGRAAGPPTALEPPTCGRQIVRDDLQREACAIRRGIPAVS